VTAVRLVQLGLGGWGRNWVEEVTRAVPGVAPVAWVEPDAAGRERAVAELDLPRRRVFGSLLEALAAVPVDAAVAVVPLAAHAEVVREALEAGLHVLVEKPFAGSMMEAGALVELARERARVLMVNQNYRWFPAPRLARRLLKERAVGDLVACYLDFHHLFGPGYRYFFLDEPLLSDMAIHHFDGLRFVLDDEPVEVAAWSWSEPGSPFRGRPAAVATVRFARGTVASYRGSWVSRGPATPFGGRWRLDGTEGTVEFTFRGAFQEREKLDRLVLHRPGNDAAPASLPDLPLKDRKGALADFAAWVRSGVPPEGTSTAEDNLKSLALMFSAIRSAEAGGRPVRVEDVLKEVEA
jgi:predicted dehydrogenase